VTDRAFLAGGGETGALMRRLDWTASPLGDPASWPQSLRSVVGLLLGSKFPMFVAWGPGLGFLYNDAYAAILGAKHPHALGMRFHDIWAEIWSDISPLIDAAMAGEATYREDLPLVMNRKGFDEQTWFTFSYSPVHDESGKVAGMFCAVAETTARVLAERRQAFLVRLGDALRDLESPQALTTLVAELLGGELGADRAGYGAIDASGEVVLVERDWTGGGVASLAGEARLLDAFGPAVIDELRAGRTLVVEDCRTDPRTSDPAYLPTWESIDTRALIVAPLIRSGRPAAVLYAHSRGPRPWTRSEAELVEEAARRTWDAIERAWAGAELRESEERFRFLDRLGEATAHASAPREIMATTARLLGSHMGVTRCAYADVDADNDRFTIRDDWTDGAPSSAGEYSLDLFGSRAAADMRSGRTLVVRDVDTELPTEDGGGMFNAIGIGAIVCCPLVKEGRLVAMMAVHQSSPRDWTKAEIVLVETVVERAWAHIERVRAEAALRESEERLRLVVEGARDYAILTTDPEGRIDAWMPGAEAVFGWSPEEAIGKPTTMTFTPEDRARGEPERELQTARREGASPDVRWHLRKDGARVFIEGRVTALRRADGTVRGFLKIGQDVTERRAAEERQALLAREVDHRAKNALAVVQTMLRLTRADDVVGFARSVEGRVAALGRAQTLLAEERWDGAVLHTMLRGELAPFLADERADLDGPPVMLPPGTAQPLAMAVHELATNAAKHGALSTPGGRLRVSWRLDGGERGPLRLRWVERGGPPVDGPPARRGFGSRVLDGTLRRQLGGAVTLTWEPAGLVCEMEVPLRRDAASAEETGLD
jgi:PAS domain S-box-containing protein